MSVFTKQFVSADEYEEWLLAVGERINVLSIKNPTGKPIYKPRQLWIRKPQMPSEVPLGSLGQQAGGAITVKYQTNDQTLVPAKSKNAILVQFALIAAAFFALFLFAISKF
jgi:hypothetical protein